MNALVGAATALVMWATGVGDPVLWGTLAFLLNYVPMLGPACARRFTLNPVLVVFSFVFWLWLWGVPGAILSAPILATTKIVCDRIRPLAALGHIIAG